MEENRNMYRIVNYIIRPLILIAVFFAAFFVSTAIMNRNNQGVTANMAECTFPTVTTVYKETEMNRMFGYADEMNAGSIRDGITLLDEANKLPVRIQTYGTQVSGIRYEVRSMDGDRLIEETEISEFEESEGVISLRLNIQDLLEDKKDYRLMLCLNTEVDDTIYYYTRIRKDGAYYAAEELQFAKEFHEHTFDKNSNDAIVKYLESNSEGDNSGFQRVTIHSSYDLVTWGSLNILDKRNMDITLCEINEQTAAITMDYNILLKNSADETEYYNVSEYYRVRYTKDRMYLLDFERTMNQIFEIENKVIYSTAVQLGIIDGTVEYMETPDGKAVSFVQEGELFAYNSTQNSMAKIFGFWQEESDVRYQNKEHDIQIINVDEKGNTDFVIYGYMNRGIHEGKVGVSVCHYDSVTNATEEYTFLESEDSYQVLKEEVGQLVYMNAQDTFYINLKNNLYQIDMNSKKVQILAEDITNDRFAVSEDNTILVIQEERSPADSRQLIYKNLKKQKEKTISCEETERIRPLGFIGTDFIYGIARQEDVFTDGNGQIVFPMYRIVIEDSSGKIKKTYEPAGIYVMSANIKDNVLSLARASKEGAGYAAVSDDQIIHSTGSKKSSIKVASITTDAKKKEYQLEFGYSLPSGKKKCLKPKEVLLENVKSIELEYSDVTDTGCYVYVKGKLDKMYTNAAEAVARADETAGVVVTRRQEYIWERMKRQTSRQIAGIETISAQSGYSSLEACVLSLLHYGGSGADARALLAQGLTPYAVLQQELGMDKVVNLTGVSLEQVLYCVDRGYPVLAATNTGNYVILTGYNELNTIVMDPVKGTTGYVGMNDSRVMFEGAGNVFIACIP